MRNDTGSDELESLTDRVGMEARGLQHLSIARSQRLDRERSKDLLTVQQ